MEQYTVHKESLFRVIYFLCISAIFLLFNHQYEHFVVKYYAYMGFTSEGVSWSSWLIGIAGFMVSSFFFLIRKSKFLLATSILIQLFFFLPNLIVYMHTGNNVVVVSIVLALLIFLNWEIFDFPSIKSVKIPVHEQSILLFILAITMLVPLLATFNLHISASIFEFGEELYEIRKENSSLGSPLVSYIFSPYVKVLVPLLIGFGFVNKSKWLSIVGILLMLVVFLLSPHKSIFVSALVVFGFALLSSFRVQLSVLLTSILFFGIAGAIAANSGSLFLNSMLVRRVFFLPAYLNSCYLEYFQNDLLFYSYGFMRKFIDYPYALEPAYLIGEAYFNSASTNANNGVISDLIINLGIIGASIGVFVIALIFKFLDALEIHAKYFGLYFLFVFTLLSSGFITVLVTHGGIFLIVLSYFFLSNTAQKHY